MTHLRSEDRNALVLASEHWHQGVVGIVASRLSEKYSCPSFMIHLKDGVGKGSCRSYGGFNLFAALESCKGLLSGFGGHELAAGFTIPEENIDAFRTRMNRYVRETCGGKLPVPSLEVDAAITCPGAVTLSEVEELGRLEPYGAGNARPVFALLGAMVDSIQPVGQGRHLKLHLSKGPCRFDAIFFSVTEDECGITAGSRVDVAFYLPDQHVPGQHHTAIAAGGYPSLSDAQPPPSRGPGSGSPAGGRGTPDRPGGRPSPDHPGPAGALLAGTGAAPAHRQNGDGPSALFACSGPGSRLRVRRQREFPPGRFGSGDFPGARPGESAGGGIAAGAAS
ncbi:MAG: DHHA1 domain-containing protein [Dysosmobacter sp.]